MTSVSRESPGPPVGGEATLTDALIALQKSFSRVSEQTGINQAADNDRPRSLITGPIEFEMTLVGDVTEPRDQLRIHNDGAITLRVKGSIRHDIVIESITAVEPPEPDRDAAAAKEGS